MPYTIATLASKTKPLTTADARHVGPMSRKEYVGNGYESFKNDKIGFARTVILKC
jgi:hypothetical protein